MVAFTSPESSNTLWKSLLAFFSCKLWATIGKVTEVNSAGSFHCNSRRGEVLIGAEVNLSAHAREAANKGKYADNANNNQGAVLDVIFDVKRFLGRRCVLTSFSNTLGVTLSVSCL
jgi:hypothetical protein